jgi:hypothetical protein
MPRFAALSPDGRRTVFESLGRLYVKEGNGAPRALTAADGDFQVYPSWSRDGSRIAFVSWNDQRLGEIRTVNADGSASARSRTFRAITAGRASRPTARRSCSSAAAAVTSRRIAGRKTRACSGSPPMAALRPGSPAKGGNPHFGAASDRVFLELSEDQKLKLISVDMNGKDRRNHAQGDLIVEYQVSPAGDHIAFRENYNVFVAPFFAGAKALDLGAKGTQLPITKVTGIGGQYLHWTGNGASLGWSLGPTLYSAATNNIVRADGGKYAAPTSGIQIGMSTQADRPQGQVALVGAKVITMANDAGGIIEDGVVLVDGNRIRAVGRRGEVAIPAGARQVDLAGKTIIPA